MTDNDNFVERTKRNHNKKTSWDKPDKLTQRRKAAVKRNREEREDADEDWQDYNH
jgi:hypothetical protein